MSLGPITGGGVFSRYQTTATTTGDEADEELSSTKSHKLRDNWRIPVLHVNLYCCLLLYPSMYLRSTLPVVGKSLIFTYYGHTAQIGIKSAEEVELCGGPKDQLRLLILHHLLSSEYIHFRRVSPYDYFRKA